MNIATIIQARMNSSRFPNKVMAQIQGKPLIEYLIDNGAVYEFDEYNAFTNMTVKCLYRGRHTFLVTPPILSKYYGINTFRVSKYVGDWDEEMKGWVFNRAYENFFTKRGAHLV